MGKAGCRVQPPVSASMSVVISMPGVLAGAVLNCAKNYGAGQFACDCYPLPQDHDFSFIKHSDDGVIPICTSSWEFGGYLHIECG